MGEGEGLNGGDEECVVSECSVSVMGKIAISLGCDADCMKPVSFCI